MRTLLSSLPLLLFLASHSFSQPTILQISSVGDSVFSHSLTRQNNGTIWITYVTSSHEIKAGYLTANSWHASFSEPLPSDLQEDKDIACCVDEKNHIWVVYQTDSAEVKAGFFQEDGTWIPVKDIGTAGSSYGLTPDYSSGVWLFNSTNATVVHTWHAVDGSLTTKDADIVRDFGWESDIGAEPTSISNLLRGAVSASFDSLVVAFEHHSEVWSTGLNYVTTYSECRTLQPDTVIRLDREDIHTPRGDGYWTHVAALGTTGSEVLVLVQKTHGYPAPNDSPIYEYYLDAYFFFGGSMVEERPDFLPALRGDSQYPQLSRDGILGCVSWISNDSMFVKLFTSHVSFETFPCLDALSDSSRENMRITVDADTTVYMLYDALKNGSRCLFAAAFKPDLTIDSIFDGVSESPMTPKSVFLYQNYPNPFNPRTIIGYFLPQDDRVSIDVFNILGEKVASLVGGFVSTGYHEVTFDASSLPSGLYFIRLTSGYGNTITKKALLLK